MDTLEIRHRLTEETRRVETRRARVLAHPELAVRLTMPPVSYQEPEQWSGYVPTATVPAKVGERLNTSPIRRALVQLLRDVVAAEAVGR